MCPTSNGSGLELEKFPDAPPTVAVTSPEDVPDAGLRSLDHCKFSGIFNSFAPMLYSWHYHGEAYDKCDRSFGSFQRLDLV